MKRVRTVSSARHGAMVTPLGGPYNIGSPPVTGTTAPEM